MRMLVVVFALRRDDLIRVTIVADEDPFYGDTVIPARDETDPRKRDMEPGPLILFDPGAEDDDQAAKRTEALASEHRARRLKTVPARGNDQREQGFLIDDRERPERDGHMSSTAQVPLSDAPEPVLLGLAVCGQLG